MVGPSKRKAMEQDIDTDDLEERNISQQPRARFSELEPSTNGADQLDDEMPGSVRAGTEAIRTRDLLPPAKHTGALDHITSHTHPAMADPAAAAATRGQQRAEDSRLGADAAVTDAKPGDKTAEEKYDQPPELFNETGVPIEPFNLNREREEGTFDAGASYIPHNFPQVKDAWLAGIDEAGGIQGTEGNASLEHPDLHPANDDPVRPAPLELPAQDLQRYKQTIASSLQTGETVLTALRRLSEVDKPKGSRAPGSGTSLEEKLEQRLGGFGQDSGVNPASNKVPKHKTGDPGPPRGHAVPKENRAAFEQLTEAAEVLLDHGETNVYSWTQKQAQQHAQHGRQQPPAKGARHEGQTDHQAQNAVDPQTYQGQTAAELTFGKQKAHDMLALKREGAADDQGGLAHPQDVTGDPSLQPATIRAAGQSVDSTTQPSQPSQATASLNPQQSRHSQPQSSKHGQPAINPVGASSNYSPASLRPVTGSEQGAPNTTTAAPSRSQAHSRTHAVSTKNVDRTKHGDAATAADKAPPDAISSQQDKPGLSGPEDILLPGYQLEGQGRAAGQKGGARNVNKPQDPVGRVVEPGTNSISNTAVGSAERPIHVTGATDVPHGGAVEPSTQSAPAVEGKSDRSYEQAAKAFATSPTETGL